MAETVGWSQETYCSELPWGVDPFACGDSLNRIRASSSMYPASASAKNPIAATYLFAVAASPDGLSSDTSKHFIVADRHECLDSVSTDCWTVSSVPGALSPVKARLVYVQTHAPGHEHSQLNLAWRLEFEMKDNFYEAYVSAHDPSKIIASIDWVKDAPAPKDNGWLTALQAKVFGETVFGAEYPVVEALAHLVAPIPSPAGAPGGSYRVWQWGINDPASGNRTLEESPYVKASSPLGWHSVPAGNDPVNSHPDLKAATIVNFTTTIGNNVSIHIFYHQTLRIDPGICDT